MNGDLYIAALLGVHSGAMKPGKVIRQDMPRHSDAFLYVLGGRAEYTFRDYRFSVEEGDVFYLSKGSEYDIDVLSDYSFIYADFEFVSIPETRKSEVYKGVSKDSERLFTKMLAASLENGGASEPFVLSYLYSIYGECVRSLEKGSFVKNKYIDHACEYIIRNYAQPSMSVADAAAFAGISEGHLRRLFSESLGISPVEYAANLRIKKARELLVSSNYDIAEICEICGFSDRYYFSKCFKKLTGLAPGAFRRSFSGDGKNKLP